ncbi:MAG: transketolase [Bacillota bacterium]|nr:transketolase [Bacillota bacterium]
MPDCKQDQLAINAVRMLSVDAVQQANSGHPGLPLGAAPMAYELWAKHMNFVPSDPGWLNRDRFILSAGHGSMLLYSLLHLFDYDLPMDEIRQFRQWGSKTPGHPEYGHTTGVEATTGPLGQGVSMAVGIALAEAHLAARYNQPDYPIINHYTYALVGDGCLMEGVSAEAASFAGTLGLERLIVLYDDNEITIDGDTDLAFREDVPARFRAYGWHVLTVTDANDTDAIGGAIETAKTHRGAPTLIVVHSTIGYGSPLAGSAKTHGAPLGAENIAKTRETLGWPESEPFVIPEAVRSTIRTHLAAKRPAYDAWQELRADYETRFPELYAGLAQETGIDGSCGHAARGFCDSDDLYDFEGAIATRKTSETMINRIAAQLPQFIGGSADLAASNLTTIKTDGFISSEDYAPRNIHFGVREFAMACISNGLALHSGLRPYCATFMIFSDYLKAALRLSALMEVPVIYVLTHDSIGVGEDGPTHEPIEQLAMLRSTPGIYTWRPADGRETAAAYAFTLGQNRPAAFALTRQNLPTLEGSGRAARNGGYILRDAAGEGELDIILLASGSEVAPAVEAWERLEAEGVRARVVSMPSIERFLEMDAAYQDEVLPPACRRRVAMEAGASGLWYRFTGLDGRVLGIDRFGASAPGPRVFAEYGITADAMYEAARGLLDA